MSELLKAVRREVARVAGSMRGAMRRGTLGTGASSSYTAQVQGIDGETWELVELWQQFGLASRPPTGGEVALAEVDGAGEGAVMVATQDRAHRPTADASEVVLYGAKAGGTQPTVRLKSTGQLKASAGGATPGSIDLTAAGGVTIATAGGTITIAPTGTITINPGAGVAILGGAASLELAVKGTTFVGALMVLVAALLAAKSTWDGSLQTPTDVKIWINAVNTAWNTFNTAAGGTGINFLATKAMVV